MKLCLISAPLTSFVADGAAPPSAPVGTSPAVAGGNSCDLEEHAGVDHDHARTRADVACHVRASRSAPGAYDIRVSRVGDNLLVVSPEQGGSA
jgi:hypothetical protein